jgi:hypothetical protein
LKIKDLIAAAGRARIEQQKQTALKNIQKSKDVRLKELNIDYKKWDQAKTSFGYIGITFLAVLFGSIFLNDFIKVCIYYFNKFRDWRQNRNELEEFNAENKENDEVILELDQIYADSLDESLEKFYVKLLKSKVIK